MDFCAFDCTLLRLVRFVFKIAMEYQHLKGFELSDLIQEGNVGLMKGVQKFDPARGYRLISYAVWWIRAEIHKFIIKGWSLVKMGTQEAQRKIFGGYQKAKRTLLNEGKDPSIEEIAELLQVTPEDVIETELRRASRDFYLDSPLNQNSERSLMSMLHSDALSPEEEFELKEETEILESAVKKALSTLTDRERDIVKSRHFNDKPQTLEVLGEKYGISRERARQIEGVALRKIKNYFVNEIQK